MQGRKDKRGNAQKLQANMDLQAQTHPKMIGRTKLSRQLLKKQCTHNSALAACSATPSKEARKLMSCKSAGTHGQPELQQDAGGLDAMREELYK